MRTPEHRGSRICVRLEGVSVRFCVHLFQYELLRRSGIGSVMVLHHISVNSRPWMRCARSTMSAPSMALAILSGR